jgi:hypothetical protein
MESMLDDLYTRYRWKSILLDRSFYATPGVGHPIYLGILISIELPSFGGSCLENR